MIQERNTICISKIGNWKTERKKKKRKGGGVGGGGGALVFGKDSFILSS